MDTPPLEDSHPVINMEDSLFPYLSQSLNQFLTSEPNHTHKKQATSILNGNNSDFEADSMPESQMELTEVDVYTQLEHKERDLMLAAELGKSLLEKNEELSKENDKLNNEYHQKVDALEQENHELRRKLDCKTKECESTSSQFLNDINRLQNDLEERRLMLVALEREKSRALEEITEQNHKLLSQLQRASEAESQLSAQVQQLRKEFLERQTSTSVRIMQLESQKEEKEKDIEFRSQLEINFNAMKDESSHLRDELNSAGEKIHQLERQLHDKEREVKRYCVELNDAHLSNRQLQVRVDELREEMSLQMSFASNGNSSLLAELEQTGLDFSEVASPDVTSQSINDPDVDNKHKSNSNDGIPTDLTLRCYQTLLSAVTNCHQHLFELKQEMWETYQRIQSTCTVLRTYINKSSSGAKDKEEEEVKEEQSHSPPSINLSVALTNLSDLIHEAIHTKEVKSGVGSEVVTMLREKQEKLMMERDEAVALKNQLEVSLASAKVDLMSVNSQLIEAIQQKLHQQKELEAWQDDMELMIQKALVERNETKRTTPQPTNHDQPPVKTSWFSFGRRRANQDSQTPTSPSQSSPQAPSSGSQQTSRFSWLKRKSQTSIDQPITEDQPVT